MYRNQLFYVQMQLSHVLDLRFLYIGVYVREEKLSFL